MASWDADCMHLVLEEDLIWIEWFVFVFGFAVCLV